MSPSPHHQRGVSFVLWLIALFPLLGFATLAIDVNNIFLVRAQVQNAADAGALAGATKLPDAAAAKTAASDVALANKAQGTAVETDKDAGDVTVGCWSFSTTGGSFTTLNCGPTTANPFNAVEVISRRSGTPVQAFFGKAVGFENYSAGAIARAYAGTANITNIPDNYVVLCGPDPFDLGDSVVYNGVTTDCRKLIWKSSGACIISNEGCTIRRLQKNVNLTIIKIGTSLDLKTGNAALAGLAGYEGTGLMPVVADCPSGGNNQRPVVKIVNAKNIQSDSTQVPCVIFTDIDDDGNVVNAMLPAKLVY